LLLLSHNLNSFNNNLTDLRHSQLLIIGLYMLQFGRIYLPVFGLAGIGFGHDILTGREVNKRARRG